MEHEELKFLIYIKKYKIYTQIFLYNEKQEDVSYLKSLGVLFFKNGSWYRTQKGTAGHTFEAVYKLFSVFSKYELISKISENYLMFKYISFEVWGNYKS